MKLKMPEVTRQEVDLMGLMRKHFWAKKHFVKLYREMVDYQKKIYNWFLVDGHTLAGNMFKQIQLKLISFKVQTAWTLSVSAIKSNKIKWDKEV